MDTSNSQHREAGSASETEENNAVSGGISISQSTCTLPHQNYLFLDEHSTGIVKKRPQSFVNDDTLEESDSAESSSGGSDNGISIGGIIPRVGSSKRQCTRKATHITCIPSITVLTSVQDAINLQIGDGSSVQVSKHVLMEVPYFNNFFSNKWEQPTHSLLGDDPSALRVLLTILHHKPHSLPLSMSPMQLFGLATVCDKYATTEIVSPYLESRNWIGALWKPDKPCDSSWAIWLWILYIFRTRVEENSSRYERVLDVLAANMRLRDGHWIIEEGNSFFKVSDIECPSKLDPLKSKYKKRRSITFTKDIQDTLKDRRRSLWAAFRNNGYEEQSILLRKTERDCFAIGSLFVFLKDLPSEPSSERSLVEWFRMLKPKRWSVRQGIIALVDPWVHKFTT